MAELGYDLSSHRFTALSDVPPGQFDAVVTVGCGNACPHIPAIRNEDRENPDPRVLPPDKFRQVRDLIDQKAPTLLDSLQKGSKS